MTNTNKKHIKRIAFIAILAGIVGAFFILDLRQYLSLDYIKASQDSFKAYYTEHQLIVIASYMLIYIAVTALSLPGAAALSLTGGALLGFSVGTIAVSFASSIGATLACAVSRFLLRDWVQGRFGDKLSAINRGIEREGKFYLFTLRLIPVFPFFIINMLMGLTRLPLWSFYWVSQIGMLAVTMVYVNAGKELAKLDSFSGILSPTLIVSFALLGLMPITMKKLIQHYRKKHGLNTQMEGNNNG